jgi:hypothetical protein
VTLAALLGIDSLLAGFALAPLLRTARGRLAAAALFGAADAAASLVALQHRGLLDAAPAMPALYGVYLLVVGGLALGVRQLPPLAVAAGLAVALSVDNLVSSAAAHDPWVAAGLGGSSAALLLLGVGIGGRVSSGLPGGRRTAWIGAGLALVACAAVVS